MLNARAVDEAVEYAIVMTGDNLSKFYHGYAMVVTEDDVTALVRFLCAVSKSTVYTAYI